MATIVNNPGATDNGAAGWAVAVVILIAVVLGGLFVWPGYMKSAQESGGTNVNVTVPALDTSSDSANGSAEGGAAM
ncbi:MAG: hypothetical protein AAB883_00665 [Patescibacteria group bacterium]